MTGRRPLGRVVDSIRRLGREPDPPLASPRQMALENAAEALGEELGDYYVDEREISEEDLAEAGRAIPADVRDRIDARREETVLYIRRRRARRRRRRRRVAIATIAMLALSLAGAYALLGDDTGEGPAGDSDPTGLAGAIAQIPPSLHPTAPDAPARGGNSVSAVVARPGVEFVTTGYVGASGGMCAAVELVHDGIADRRTRGGCPPPEGLVRGLDRSHAVFTGIVQQGAVVMRGFANRDVVSLGGRGWAGKLDVDVSRPWRPEAHGLDKPLPPMEPLRVFVAVAYPTNLASEDYRLNADRMLDSESYGLRARLSDGRLVPVEILGAPE